MWRTGVMLVYCLSLMASLDALLSSFQFVELDIRQAIKRDGRGPWSLPHSWGRHQYRRDILDLNT